MRTFEVEIVFHGRATITVEAGNAKEAKERAIDLCPDPDEYWIIDAYSYEVEPEPTFREEL